MGNICLTLHTKVSFGSFLKSPTQMGSLSINNSVTNISRLGTFKGTVSRDFLLLVFLMNQFPPSLRVSHYSHYKFFQKFAEIFTSQGAPQVSTTPVANLPQVSTTPALKLPPVSTAPAANLPPVSTTPAANFGTSFASVVDTGGKFATGVNDTGGKFPTGVNDAGGKSWVQYQAVETLK